MNPLDERNADIRCEAGRNDSVIFYKDLNVGVSCYRYKKLSPVYKDSVVTLKFHSYDFAAGSKLVIGFNEWSDSLKGYPEFIPVHIDNQYSRLPDSLRFILTVPRDEDLKKLKIPVQQITDKDTTIIYVNSSQIGDRLGDPWEEDNYSSDVQDYNPYEDNSNIDISFYPSDAPDEVKKAGDGFINFEKYRGFYGIVSKSMNHNAIHVRLDPVKRNIFNVQFIGALRGTSNLIGDTFYDFGFFDRGYRCDYFSNIGDYPVDLYQIVAKPIYETMDNNYIQIIKTFPSYGREVEYSDCIRCICVINNNKIEMPNKKNGR